MAAYKYGTIPSEKAQKEDTADFWEIQALREFGIPVSEIDILKVVAKEFDELNNDGIESQEDFYSDRLNDVFSHLSDRVKYSYNNYPFRFNRSSIEIDQIESSSDYLYVFLLLATRLNMGNDRVHGGVDGTLLFEFICSHAIKQFFGDNAQSFLFGTGAPGNFAAKVTELIHELGEGGAFKNANINPPTKNDDGIDVVVWKDFADNKEGKLIGFGQCKTGTTWRDKIHKLKPADFCMNWFKHSPVVQPIAIVFLTDTLYEDQNFITDQRGFLVFNRFRVMEYSITNLPEEVFNDIKSWVDAVIQIIQTN
ncbi:hypothetical protein [Lewinella sp. IMCC34191]|uniref:hypothetical protein n=1 Tax=Lewinella sp. IMCC34191 TaxID=2259172 RepID=UPI000E230B31|nr:hypothetical protein [Lewinella sp. IMCC34191]